MLLPSISRHVTCGAARAHLCTLIRLPLSLSLLAFFINLERYYWRQRSAGGRGALDGLGRLAVDCGGSCGGEHRCGHAACWGEECKGMQEEGGRLRVDCRRRLKCESG